MISSNNRRAKGDEAARSDGSVEMGTEIRRKMAASQLQTKVAIGVAAQEVSIATQHISREAGVAKLIARTCAAPATSHSAHSPDVIVMRPISEPVSQLLL